MTPSERNGFRRWMIYELNGKQKELLKIWDLKLVAKYSPGETWKELFPAQPFKDEKLRQLSGKLLAKLETYLAVQQFRKEKIWVDMAFLTNLNGRNLPKLFEKEMKKIRNRLKKQGETDLTHFRWQYELEVLEQQHLLKYSGKIDHHREQALINSFNTWVMIQKLELALMHLNVKQVLGDHLEDPLLIPFLDALTQGNKQASLILYLFQQTYHLLTGKLGEGSKRALLELMTSEQAAKLDQNILKNLFNLITNHYIGILNRELSASDQHLLFEWYRWGIQSQLIIVDKILPIRHFKNVMTASLGIGKLKEAKQYLETLAPLLPEQDREDVRHYHLATLLFAEDKFSSAIRVISSTKFRSLPYDLASRALDIKAQYENCDWENIEEVEFLKARVLSLDRFLKNRMEIPSVHRHSFGYFVKQMSRLLRSSSISKLENMRANIYQDFSFYAHRWIVEKIDQKMTTLKQEQESG
ncbi:MAG: hypothetical protein AAF587_18815 [Bacteroidota bacterium]